MPLFIDIHDVPGITREDAAKAHELDVRIQGEHGVEYQKYWLNKQSGKIFCMCAAPNAEAANAVHRAAHGGMAANRIIEVTPEVAELFMGETDIDFSGVATVPGTQGTELDPGIRTVMFTDIVGSTGMTQRLGDVMAMEIVEVHDRIVRGALSAEGGRVIKHTGDGIMAVFNVAASAIRCGASIQRQLRASPLDMVGEPLRVRIGIASGQPVERDNDLFGTTVQLAARLCAYAAPEQIVITSGVAQLCPDAGLPFHDLGAVPLKGFPGPIDVKSVQW
jgi:class 3 adenylate cyclase